MILSGVKKIRKLAIVSSILLAGCSGGGGTSGPQIATPAPTLAPTPSPSPTATISGVSPGPVIATWKGDGSFTAQSDPNWPVAFIPVPGDPKGSWTKGPPIVFTGLGQTVTVTLSQANFTGVLPTFTTFVGNCTGLSAKPAAQTQMRVFYSAVGSSNCTVQFDGDSAGSYQGAAVVIPITVPG